MIAWIEVSVVIIHVFSKRIIANYERMITLHLVFDKDVTMFKEDLSNKYWSADDIFDLKISLYTFYHSIVLLT